jgi:hypothetical protein
MLGMVERLRCSGESVAVLVGIVLIRKQLWCCCSWRSVFEHFCTLVGHGSFHLQQYIGHEWTPDWLSDCEDELSLRTDSRIPW